MYKRPEDIEQLYIPDYLSETNDVVAAAHFGYVKHVDNVWYEIDRHTTLVVFEHGLVRMLELCEFFKDLVLFRGKFYENYCSEFRDVPSLRRLGGRLVVNGVKYKLCKDGGFYFIKVVILYKIE